MECLMSIPPAQLKIHRIFEQGNEPEIGGMGILSLIFDTPICLINHQFLSGKQHDETRNL